MPIRLLATDVSSKIAAGEVIERPASVVKELVENSLDAGASDIAVEVRGGGTEYIRVADNGAGIPSDEAELAFQRYATSKLSDADDLESVSTLGFRGEALPSIAAVSRVVLVTRTASEDSGTRIEPEDGRIVAVRPHGASQGTVVTISRLFQSFPARRKFLRTPATEVSRVQTLITRYALAYPGVRFKLTVEGSDVFASSGSGRLREAVADVYDAKVAQAMLELSPEPAPDKEPRAAVSGLIGPASIDRPNRRHIALFVNGRWVQSRALGYAIEQAYHGFLKERRFPVAVISISVPPEELDVNVHPAKAEVRFRREGQVFAAVQQAVRRTLTLHSPVPEVRASRAPGSEPADEAAGRPFWPSDFSVRASHHVPAPRSDAPQLDGAPTGELPHAPQSQPLPPKKALPVLRVLGQVHSTYIAAEGPDGIYMIDQHAAHERVLFERVVAEALSGPPKIQSLLEPVSVELSARQNELVESHADLIARIGLQLESFGPRTFLIRGVPSAMPDGDAGKSLVEVLELMADGGGFESWDERAAYSIACHGAVRAGRTLSQQEMAELVRQLEDCQQPHTCPHARPTMIHMSSGHLEREFGRR